MCLCSWACAIRQYGARASLFGEPRFALVFTCMSYVHSYLKYPDVSWRAGGKVPSDRTQPRVCPQWRRCKAIHGGGIRENQTIQEQIRNIRSWIHTHKHTFVYTWHEVCVLNKYVCIHTHTHTHTYMHICETRSKGLTSWLVSPVFSKTQDYESYATRARLMTSIHGVREEGVGSGARVRLYIYTYIHTYIHICTYIHTHTYIYKHIHMHVA